MALRQKRRQYLVNPPLQYHFIGILLVSLLLMTVGALGSVYFALWFTMSTYGLADDPAVLAQLTTVGLVVTFELLIFAPLVVWLGLRMTHRVAGPLVRITASLQQMAAGNYQQHLTLRKGDSLQDLAELINQLAATLRSHRNS